MGYEHFMPVKQQLHKNMKHTLQIHIHEIFNNISVRGPFNPLNNAAYKLVNGQYDKGGRRWILPDAEESRQMLDELFGSMSPTVAVAVEFAQLTSTGNQSGLGGYLIANWDTRKNCIRLGDGIELIDGAWDVAKSAVHQAPCVVESDALFHILVRRNFAVANGLEIIAELGEEILINPLAPFSDSDLREELERRGYRVERRFF